MRYRRADMAGGTYFFTINKDFIGVDHIDILRAVIQKVKSMHPFRMVAMVILPDHLHTVWSLPAGDCDYPMRWMLIKSGFSRQIPKDERRSESRQAKGERAIWQRRYWEHFIRDQRDYEKHVDYIHFNPVKHSYVKWAADWPYSTFHRYVERGLYPLDWSGRSEVDLKAGEQV